MAKIHLPKLIKRFKDWTRHVRRLHLLVPLWWRNRTSVAPIVQADGPVVSLTSYGQRTKRVYLAIESIGRGVLKPSAITLWLDGSFLPDDLPAPLRRLIKRGLQVVSTPDYGPHKKYFPHVLTWANNLNRPLVTADDDMLYPRDWLLSLDQAHRDSPEMVHCFWAKTIGISLGQVVPYAGWRDCHTDRPGFTHMAIGCSGVIYPVGLQRALAMAGDAFMSCCPKADDLWLHVNSLRNGYPVRQIRARSRKFPCIPGTESSGLVTFNEAQDGNNRQFAQTYRPDDVQRLAAAAAVEVGAGTSSFGGASIPHNRISGNT